MFHKGVSIAVERDGRVLVTEDLGECFHVHAAFDGAGGKCMPQGMETDMPPFFGPIVMLVNSIYSSASLSAS